MSKLHIDQGEAIRGRKVCLATISYDKPDDGYTFSMASSRSALHSAGIGTAYYFLQGNCHVDDARNRIVQEFLLSDCTELVFLDADVSWQPEDLVKLCQHEAHVVGAVYPFRREDKLDDMPIRLIPGADVNEDGLLEVEGLPTGFLRFRRTVIEILAQDCESFDGNNGHETMVPILFQRTLIDGTRWGGDLDLCNRWRAKGGRVMCDPDITLGHTAKVTYTDSLSKFQRRKNQTTLKYVAGRIRDGEWTIEDLKEARKYVSNPFGALEDVLAIAVGFAAKADGPIIETGSGLTTILMAAATDQQVWCLEHHALYAAQLQQMAVEAEVYNISLCTVPIKGCWYDLTEDAHLLPDRFAFGLNDGPPHGAGIRTPFLQYFGDRCDAFVCDDADNEGYRAILAKWAAKNGRSFRFVQPRTALISASALNAVPPHSEELLYEYA